MLLGIPLAIYFGIATIISLFITFIFGLAVYNFHKPVFKQHRFFAYLTAILAVIHFVLAFLLWFYGVSI